MATSKSRSAHDIKKALGIAGQSPNSGKGKTLDLSGVASAGVKMNYIGLDLEPKEEARHGRIKNR